MMETQFIGYKFQVVNCGTKQDGLTVCLAIQAILDRFGSGSIVYNCGEINVPAYFYRTLKQKCQKEQDVIAFAKRNMTQRIKAFMDGFNAAYAELASKKKETRK